MSSPNELLLLRLALLAIIFAFVLSVSLVLRGGLRPTARASGPHRRPLARLVVIDPGQSALPLGASFDLGPSMTIGRDASNSIVVADTSVSGRHATLIRTRTGWLIRDLGSTNGTFIDRRPVGNRGAPVEHGQQITIGGVAFEIRLLPSPASAASRERGRG